MIKVTQQPSSQPPPSRHSAFKNKINSVMKLCWEEVIMVGALISWKIGKKLKLLTDPQ